MGEMRRTYVASLVGICECFPRHRLDGIQFAKCDENLKQTDARAVDQRTLTDRLRNSKRIFHAFTRFDVFARMEAAPSELDHRRCDFARVARFAPDRHRFVDRFTCRR